MRGPYLVRKRSFLVPPWGPVLALTIVPFIFLRRGWPSSRLRHELIHVHQVRQQGWIRFYARYVWLWLRGTPYRELPAEVEAFAHEHDPSFLPADLEALVRADP